MRKIVIVVLLMFGMSLFSFPWDTPEEEARRLVNDLRNYSRKLKSPYDTEWDIFYVRLQNRMDKCGPIIVPFLIEEITDTTEYWIFRDLCASEIISMDTYQREHNGVGLNETLAKNFADALLKVMRNPKENEGLLRETAENLSFISGTYTYCNYEDRLNVLNELLDILDKSEYTDNVKWKIIQGLPRFSRHFGDKMYMKLGKYLNDNNPEIRKITAVTLLDIVGWTQKYKMSESLRVKMERATNRKLDLGKLTFVSNEIMKMLLNRLKIEDNGYVKELIVNQIIIRKIKEPAIPFFMEALKTGKYISQDLAIRASVNLDIKEAIPFIRHISDSIYKAKGSYDRDILRALGWLGDTSVLSPLIEIVKKDKAPESEIEALGILGDKRAIKPIMDFLEREFAERKIVDPFIFYALIRLDAREAIPMLERMLTEQENNARKRRGKVYGALKEKRELFERFKKGEKIEIERRQWLW